MKKLGRRQFLSGTLKTGAGVMLYPHLAFGNFGKPETALTQAADSEAADHFFLFITLPNPSSIDVSYLFDARPLEMTEKQLLQNYRDPIEPMPWVGKNGGTCLASELTQPLRDLKSYFSVVNGVGMSALDGHDQNFNYIYSGDTFGGESFIPHLNRGRRERPLDILQRGRVRATVLNAERTIPLGPPSAVALIKSLNSLPPLSNQSELFQYLNKRFEDASKLNRGGAFSVGASHLHSGFSKAPQLAAMLKQVHVDPADTNRNFINMIAEFFRCGAARSAVLSINLQDEKFDTHDVANAQAQPRAYGKLASSLAEVIQGLKDTPYDDKRSMMDVTTFLFSAEFSRTMRQLNRPINQTGTDHNQFCNTILIGGKGIENDLVLGASDFQTSAEILSAAHLSLDSAKLKFFGRPFDFKSSRPRDELPVAYVASDYLNFNSIVNSIYKLFAVPQSKWRLIERNAPVAPVLDSLLS